MGCIKMARVRGEWPPRAPSLEHSGSAFHDRVCEILMRRMENRIGEKFTSSSNRCLSSIYRSWFAFLAKSSDTRKRESFRKICRKTG